MRWQPVTRYKIRKSHIGAEVERTCKHCNDWTPVINRDGYGDVCGVCFNLNIHTIQSVRAELGWRWSHVTGTRLIRLPKSKHVVIGRWTDPATGITHSSNMKSKIGKGGSRPSCGNGGMRATLKREEWNYECILFVERSLGLSLRQDDGIQSR